MCPGKLQGCQRGLFGIESWAPLPRPSSWETASPTAHNGRSPQSACNSASQPRMMPTGDGSVTKKRMVAKYSYKVNPSSPLGKELAVSQTEKLWYVAEHAENLHWWLAENEQGKQGYVPKTYMMIVEDKAGGLPWLQPKAPATNGTASSVEPAITAFGAPEKSHVTGKPYKSTYQHADLRQETREPEYYCKICEKTLNGPKPYQAHMMSKSHKEMVEYMNGES